MADATPPQQKLAIFLFNLEGGGAERAAMQLANGIAAEGKQVQLVLAQQTGPYLSQLDPRVEVRCLNAKRQRYMLWPLVRYLRREKPTAMLSVMTHPNQIAVLARAISHHPMRLVLSEHSTVSQWLKEVGQDGALPKKILRVLYGRGDALVTVSKAAAADCDALLKWKLGRTIAIYNPVVTDKLASDAMAPMLPEHQAFFNAPVLLAVGRFEPVKNLGLMLDAFAKARKQTPMKLMLLGEGSQRAELEQKAASLGLGSDVLMPGFVANPYAYMKRATACVLSSHYEGLPSVLIEALACGTPVVATDCPSGPREILQDGKYGALTPAGEVDALAAAMVEVVKNNGMARQRAELFRHEAMEQYTVQHAVREYLKLLMLPQDKK